MTLSVAPHPLLDLSVFTVDFPDGLGESPDWLVALLKVDAAAPMHPDDHVRLQVRDLLRHGGFKPTGRSKPASEYLLRAAGEGVLGSINVLVDACNVVSLHSGLPISVVDLVRVEGVLSVGIAPEGSSYPFNAGGQVIDVGGLLCLCDQQGPCANAVKDAQRTKTTSETRQALVVVWGASSLWPRSAQAAAWYHEILGKLGAATVNVAV